MDSLLSLQTPNPPPVTFPHPLPDISTPAPNYAVSSSPTTNIAAGVPLPSLLVPKSEPLDEFLATQDPQQQTCGFSPAEGSDDDQVHDLYTEFFRVSELFRRAFGQTLPPQFGAEDANANSPKHANANSPRHPNPQSCDGNAVVSDQDPNSRAIVPVPAATQESTVTVARRRQSRVKVKELVRVTDLSVKDQMHFREVVRRTRMIYDSLRVLASVEEEKRAAAAGQPAEPQPEPQALNGNNGIPAPAEPQPEPEPEVLNGKNGIRRRCRSRIRGDLRAAALMRERGLWLNREKRIVGAIPGVFVGDLFFFRMELCVVGLHNQIQAGIDYLPSSMSSNGEPIATSVIVSGGYEDDMDDGEVIVYTGHGGQEKNSSRQVSDQKLVGGNLALERSMHYGIEVRVIRGMRYEGSASGSGKVYVYDGLYKIVDCWFDVGKSGFGVYKYKLWRIEGQAKMGSAVLKDARDVRRSGLDFKPVYCLSVDISNKRETVAIRVFNDIDDNEDPLCFEYLPRTSFPQFVFHQSGKATGCDCVDGCADGCFCSMKNGGEFPYNQQGFLVRGKPLIFECGPFCTCPPHCRNRVTQKGIKNRLEVFRSRQTGWGVRSLDLIHAGAFICEYTGVVLTREQAQILTMNGDSLIYPNRFSERWAEWGDLSQIYSDYVRPSYPSIPPLDFSLDVSTMRNVACYISHSSSPNVLVQFVLYDHNNLMFPHLMLFAMENIPPMRELSLDYGVADEWTGKLSICN